MANPFDQFDKPKANPFDQFDAPEAPAEEAYLGSDVAAEIGDLTAGGTAMPVSTMVNEAVKNIPASAGKFAKDIVQPIIHPIDTAKAAGNLILGAIQKGANAVVSPETQLEMGGSFGKEYEPYAEAVGKFFADRYGGLENLKKTIATDPVGFAADASTVLTLGGSAVAQAPGKVGQVGAAIKSTGEAVNPLNAAMTAAKPIAGLAGKAVSGVIGQATGAGGESIRTAAKAGMKGGDVAEDFQANLRGRVPMEDVVSDAKGALSNIRQTRGGEYRSGMSGIKSDTTVLDFADIDKAVLKAAQVKNFKGVPISKSTAGVSQEIIDLVDEWKKLDPAEFHTAEGLDALKQAIGDIRDATQYGTPSRTVANQAYNAVKDRIVKQAPEYGKVMKDYEVASDLIREMEKTLSLNAKASVDTSLRKLQSVMRNNANTNYGKRVDLAEMLQEAGASNLMEKLSGQMLSSSTPRGLAKLYPTATGMAALMNPYALAALPLESPRLMGEAAYYTGKGAGAASDIYNVLPSGTSQAAFQGGRLSTEEERRQALARALEGGR